jgi:hypothetical protein
MEDVVNYGEIPEKLMNLRNLGKKSFFEIESLLRDLDLEKNSQGTNMRRNITDLVGNVIGEVLKEAYDSLFVEENNTATSFRLCYPSVEELHCAVVKKGTNMQKIYPDLSLTENIEIRKMFASYLDCAIRGMHDRQCMDNSICAKYEEFLSAYLPQIKEISYKDKADFFITPSAREYLQTVYVRMCKMNLSVRAQKFIDNVAPNFETLVPLFEKDLKYYRVLCPSQNMSRTLKEILELNKTFKIQFDCCWMMTDEEAKMAQLRDSYPFLTSIERKFVMEYRYKNGSDPLFFLLYKYMRISEDRGNKIFSLLYGIFDGKEHSLTELSEAMKITRERVRQIASRKLEVHDTKIIVNDGWKKYKCLFSLPYITAESKEYILIKEHEHLSFDFRIFSRLMQLLGCVKFETESNCNGEKEGVLKFSKQYETVVVGDFTAVINRNEMPLIKFGTCVNTLRSLISSNYTADTLIPVEASLNAMDDEEKNNAVELMACAAVEGLGLHVNERHEILVRKNYVDVANDLYMILSKKGTPMSVNEIIEAFKSEHPEYENIDSSKIRHYLYIHPNIKAIGNSSRYGLDCWKDVFYGSIRDLLVKLLMESDRPLHIQQLFESVVVHFSTTNIKSIEWSMVDDTLKRFIQFNDGYFGLRCKKYDDSFEEYIAEKQRSSFDERYMAFREFVKDYNRYPESNNGEHEASLCRWMYNVMNGVLDVTYEQKLQMERVLKLDELDHIPRNAIENEFRNKCRAYKSYIDSNYSLPTVSKEPELYNWMIRSKSNYNSYVDHRRSYLTELFNYIVSLGFNI